MSDFQIPDKDLLTSVDRSADTFIIYDNSASGLKRTNVNYALDLTSHPVGIDDVQTLTNKTLTAPIASSPVLSGTITGTYTLGGTPTFPSSVVTLTGSQTLTNKVLTSPTINNAVVSNPTLTVDTVSEHTSANGVTIDGLNIKDSKLNTNNSVVTNNITDSAVTPVKWTNPYKFSVYRTAAHTSSTSATKITFDTELFDSNNNFATGTYTAPVAGFYQFNAIAGNTIATGTQIIAMLYKNGALEYYGSTFTAAATASLSTVSALVQLAANDTVEVYFIGGAGSTMLTGKAGCFFQGFLVSQT